MRTLLIGLLGGILLLGGLAAGVGGVGLQLSDPCSPSYRPVLQPADSVDDPPDATRSFESLSEYQQTAVEAGLSNRTRRTFRDRAPLERLTAVVIVVDGDRYVVTDLVESPCRDLYDELAIGGFASAVCGFLLGLFAVVRWRVL